MFDNAMRQAFSSLEKERGLPAGFLTGMAGIESRFGAAPDRRGSQYKGMFQLGNDVRRQFGVTNPADWRQSAAAAAGYASQNAGILRKALGRDPTGHELYMAHQQGAGGSSALLSNPDAPAGSLVNPKFILANGGDPNAPARAFTDMFGSKYDNNLRSATQGATPSAPMQQGMTAPGVGGASGSGIPSDGTPNPMMAAMNSPEAPAAPAAQEQPSFGDALGNIAGRLGGVGVALMSIDNPKGAAALASSLKADQRSSSQQFRGFTPNGKGMMFSDANGKVSIQAVPEAYQGPKESDTPSSIRTLEALAQRPDLMKIYKETHGGDEENQTALTPEGVDSATELYVSSGGKMGMVGLNKTDKTAVTNNLAKWAEAHGKTMGDVIANGPKMAGFMSQEREMGRASTRMQTAKSEMDATLKTLEDRASKLPPDLVNGSVPWNKFMQFTTEQLNKEGRPELAAYRETIQNAANAYATILARGAAVVPVAMQNRANELFNSYMSPDTIKGVTGTMRDTSDRMMQSLKFSQENIRSEIAGRPLPHPNIEQDIEGFLQKSSNTPSDTPAAAGGQTPQSMPEGARQAPDGNFYVQKDGKWHKVIKQ